MKKTWTTKILIALLTLAMVVGVVAIAPKEAQAASDLASAGITATSATTVSAGQTISLRATYAPSDVDTANIHYQWYSSDASIASLTDANTQDMTVTAVKAGTTKINVVVSIGGISRTGAIDVTVQGKATGVTPSSINGFVGKGIDQSLTATGGYPATYTWRVSSGTLPAGLELSSSGRISGTPTAAVTATVRLIATNTAGDSTELPVTLTIGKGDQTVTALANGSAENIRVDIGSTVTLSTTDTTSGGGNISWTQNSASITDLSVKLDTAGTYEFTATAAENEKYNAKSDSVTVEVTKPIPSFSVSPMSMNLNYGGSYTLTANSANTADAINWTISGGGTFGSTSGSNTTTTHSGESVVYYAPASGSGAITPKITVSQTPAASSSYSKPKDIIVNVTVSPTFDVSPTSLSLRANSTTTQSFNVVTAAGAEVTAVSSDNNVVEIVSKSSVGNDTVHTVTVKPIAAGDAEIRVTYAGTTKTVKVHVANANPVISQVDFRSCDWCTPNLTKVNNWGQLTITVKDYNPTNPYVTVTRSNIRTYIQGGSYFSHGSTYSYVATLTPINNGLDGQAVLYVIPQYNGTTYYTASYTGAVSKNSPTIYVTGFTTLPQTGPNYIWAYVLGGLCLATVATAVTLNVRKKKRENI